MDRRAFIGTLAGSLLAAPLAAEAQQPDRVRRLGLLLPYIKVMRRRTLASQRSERRCRSEGGPRGRMFGLSFDIRRGSPIDCPR